MSEESINLVKKIYDAFNSRKYSTVLEYFSHDFEWVAAETSPLADRSPYHGTNEVRDWVFGRIAAGFEKLEVRVDEIFGVSDKVVALGYYESIYQGSTAGEPTQVAHLWTISS